MICPGCQAENPVGTKSCISCGKELTHIGISQHYSPDEVAGNNSGTAISDWQVPRSVNGLTMAGFVPFGLYAFFNGMVVWGLVGLVLYSSPFYLVYLGYITFYGRREAWRNRRFNNLSEFEATMSAWNIGGIACGVIYILVILAWTWLFSNLVLVDPAACNPPGIYGGG